MPEASIASAEFREVQEGRLTDNSRTYALAPFLEGDARARYLHHKRRYPQYLKLDDGTLPPTFEQTQYCKDLIEAHGSKVAAEAVRSGNVAVLSFLTGLTNREVPLSEARTLMRLLIEMRRDGFLGLFVGDTDNGKTNTALWLSLLFLLDQISLGKDVVLATNVTSLEWSDPELNQRTINVKTRSALQAVCKEHERVVSVLDELEMHANATTNNHEVNEHFNEVLQFKSKEGLVLFPIFHRTDGFGAAPVIRNHATYFMNQIRTEHDLEDDEYAVEFYKEHNEDVGFTDEAYSLPVPPLQPDGDYDPDEKADFVIAN